MRITKTGLVRLFVGIGAGLLCTYLAVTAVNLDDFKNSLASTDPTAVAIGLFLVLVTTYGKAARWRTIVGSQPSSLSLVPPMVIGQMANTLVPVLRVGEIIRTYLASEATGLGKAFLLGSLALEKLVDGVCLLLIVVVIVPFFQLPGWLISRGMSAGLAVLMLLVLVAGLGLFGQSLLGKLSSIAGQLPGPFGLKLVRIADQAMLGVIGLRGWRPRLSVALWSLVVWFSGVATNIAIFKAVGLPLDVTLGVILIVVGFVTGSVGTVPGRVGVFHGVVVATLSLAGIPAGPALGYAVILHLVVFGPQIVLGLAFLWRESIDFRRIFQTPVGQESAT